MGNPTITMLQPYKRQIFCMLKWNGQICPAQIHHFYYNMSSHPNLPNKQIEILRSGFYVADSHPFFNRWPSFKRFGQLIPSIPRLHQMRSAFQFWSTSQNITPGESVRSLHPRLLQTHNFYVFQIKKYKESRHIKKLQKGYKNKLKKKHKLEKVARAFCLSLLTLTL